MAEAEFLPDPGSVADVAATASGPEPAEGETSERVIQALIPGYASLARLGVALLAASPLASAPGASVLVAGCGSGAELLEAQAQRPDWQLTGLDPSAAMLERARRRLGAQSSIHWVEGTLEAWPGQESFDGALAVLVLQSLPDDGSKLAFLTALARRLRRGAQVVLVDLMRPERSPLQQQLIEARLGFQRASGLEPGSQAIDGLAAPAEALHPIGLSRLTALVAAAGFGDPAPVFQALDVEGFLLQRRD